MKATDARRALSGTGTLSWALILPSVTLWVLSLAVPALAQSDPAGSAADTIPPEYNAEPQLQGDNTPNPEDQSPILKADENSIPSKPSIPLSEPSRLTFGDRLTLYRRSIFSPEIIVGPAVGGALSQLRNDPPEWRQGAAGYGRGAGSGLARNIIARTISFGFAAADGEDPRYIRSEESETWARVRHAIVWTFVTRNQSGTRMPAFSRWVGAYGAAFAVNNWYPSRENNSNHALKMGTSSIASSVAFHILSEFWPNLRKTIHFKPQ